MPDTQRSISLDEAVDVARTGDIWVFRGTSRADKAIRLVTNAPVNHVGMAVVIDDLPPLMWHAELGKGLVDMWTGAHQRGVQLHDLREAVTRWSVTYHQQGWFRQLTPEVTRAQEDAMLQVIARWDGTPFPKTAAMVGRWLRGRAGTLARPRRGGRDGGGAGSGEGPGGMSPQEVYCAEVVAVTYQAMGLLDDRMPSLYFDPGQFWSGDQLALKGGYELGTEIAVRL